MISVFDLRKMINDRSSDKAKVFSGKCSLSKKLKNGYGASIMLKTSLILHHYKIINNVYLRNDGADIALIGYVPKNIKIKNLDLVGFHTGFMIREYK